MTVSTESQDAAYMARAIKLASRGLFTTDPNPRVGCVLVKQNKIVAEGWHVRAGQGHAEVEALKQVHDAREATAYVTLEPCSHHGRTPPCCDALIQAGVARVVVAMEDPNPLVAGQGLARLKAAGVDVRAGVLQEDAQTLNPGFIKRMLTGRPFVRSKLAMSLDGRTAMASGESKWITSPQARADVHRLRARSSAIMTGIETVLADDPALTVRIEEDVLQPVRVVLDSQLRMPLTAQMLSLPGRNLIVTCSREQKKIEALRRMGCEVYCLEDDRRRVSLAAVTGLLGDLQINEVLVEAGPTLNGALIAANLVDEWIVYMATSVLGNQARGLFNLPNVLRMADRKCLKLLDVRHIGPDLRLTLRHG